MQYILFDIDGTLIDSGGAGMRSLNLAFEEVYSIGDAFSSISMAGKTDLQIVTEALGMHDIASFNGNVPRFFMCYIKHLRNTIDHKKGHIKPGIRQTLEMLRMRDDIALGLLTGNIERGAMIKLEAFGLAQFFEAGAFGDHDSDRNKLLPRALEALREKRGIEVDFRQCVVIGDTPRDVECSKPYGAYAVAVATGPYSYHDLSAVGADVVFHDLSDTDSFLHILHQRQKIA